MGRTDTICNPFAVITRLTTRLNHCKRLLRVNVYPYKCRFYSNSQPAMNCYTVVLYLRMIKYYLCKKISFATFGVSIDDFLRDTLVWATAYISMFFQLPLILTALLHVA